MHISVVLIVNDGIFFQKVLKSLYDQSYARDKFEIIIVDISGTYKAGIDYSISDYNIRYYQNLGSCFIHSFFLGISKANYKIVAILHEHMEAAPDWLHRINEAFEEKPDLCILTGRVIINPETDFPVFFEKASYNKPRSKLYAFLGEINLSSIKRELQAHESIGVGNMAFNSVLCGIPFFIKKIWSKGKNEIFVVQDLLRKIRSEKKIPVFFHPELITYKLIDLKELNPDSLISVSYKMGFYDGKKDIQITKSKVRTLTIYTRRTMRYLLSPSFYRTLFNKDEALSEKKCIFLYDIGYSIGLFF